jgi:hypothetical protein
LCAFLTIKATAIINSEYTEASHMTRYRRRVSEERVIRISRATAIREVDVRKVLEEDAKVIEGSFGSKRNNSPVRIFRQVTPVHYDMYLSTIDEFYTEWEKIT